MKSGNREEQKSLSGFQKSKISAKGAEDLRPSAKENVDRVKERVFEKRRVTLHEVANITGNLFVSVQSILRENLNVSSVAVKFMPYKLILLTVTRVLAKKKK